MSTIREISKAKTYKLYGKIYRDLCIGLSVKELARKYTMEKTAIYTAMRRYLIRLNKKE